MREAMSWMLRTGFAAEQRPVRAQHRGVAQELEALPGHVGQQAQIWTAFSTLMYLPKDAANQHLLGHLQRHAHALGQHGEPGIDGGLGPNQVIDIHTGKSDVPPVRCL